MAATRKPQPADEPAPTTPAPEQAAAPAPAPASTEPHPVGDEVPAKRSFRERVTARPLVTTGVAALVAFCVAGVGGFAIGHAVGDDHGPRESVARYDEGGMRGENGPRDGYGFGDRSDQGPGGDRSEQGQNGDGSDEDSTRELPGQDSTERPGQGSTETPDQAPDGDVPATPEQGGAAAVL